MNEMTEKQHRNEQNKQDILVAESDVREAQANLEAGDARLSAEIAKMESAVDTAKANLAQAIAESRREHERLAQVLERFAVEDSRRVIKLFPNCNTVKTAPSTL